jgi:protein-S-isoprenylcysteine O-methyltransferase
MLSPVLLGVLYGLSEFGLSAFRRSKQASSEGSDRSLGRIWLVIGLAMTAGIGAYYGWPAARVPRADECYWIGLAILILGLALRWYAILYLGRFFTVNVIVVSDQRVIDTGPYRYIRHPSYTGVLLAFIGIGVALANLASIVLIIVPVTAVFLYRIRVEEAALTQGLGEAYRSYMQRTKRLVPFVY